MASHILLRHQVHAILKRCDQHNIRRGVELHQPFPIKRLVLVQHHLRPQRPKPAIDPPHRLLNHVPGLPVMINPLPGGRRNL